ncbi:MAG: YfcC family protein [Clostridia bacterium]|nr:YfcC family protein [Clostridia bacterium]
MDKEKKGIPVPHVYVILMGLILICSLLSYVVPAGQYDMMTVGKREVVDASTYHVVESTPVTLMQMLSAVPRGMTESAQIIFFIFIVGGAFAILEKTGAIEAGIGKVCQLLGNRTLMLLPVILLLFSLGGAVFGMSEETIPFIPIFVSLCIAMGYDSITGTAIVFCGAAAGYAGAFMNPFTLQVAQGIAGLPILSGMGFRIVMYIAFLALSSTFIMLYASRIKKNPEKSPMYHEDQAREDIIDLNNLKPFGTHEKAILTVFAASIVLLVYGVIRWGWYMDEISALFMGMAIVIAIVARMTPNAFAVTFGEGMAGIASGALVIGFARGLLVVMTDGNILHTILHAVAGALSGLPSMVSAVGMYIFQCLLNFMVPSGSGQAAVSIPIMAPLGDLVGVTRQTACVAFQLGDAISNIFTPTSGFFMAGLALARIPWTKWARWILPLISLQYALGAVFVVIAHLIGLGPF